MDMNNDVIVGFGNICACIGCEEGEEVFAHGFHARQDAIIDGLATLKEASVGTRSGELLADQLAAKARCYSVD